MAISEEIRASIEAAVHDLYFVKKDENGYASIECMQITVKPTIFY